jgi:hypothetical protein
MVGLFIAYGLSFLLISTSIILSEAKEYLDENEIKLNIIPIHHRESVPIV